MEAKKNKMIRAVVFVNIRKMLLLGLDRTPFVRDLDERDLMCETYVEALEDAKFTDADEPRISACWRAMRRTQTKWFSPPQLISAIRTTYRPEFPSLPNMSDEKRNENLLRLGEMMKELKINGEKK